MSAQQKIEAKVAALKTSLDFLVQGAGTLEERAAAVAEVRSYAAAKLTQQETTERTESADQA